MLTAGQPRPLGGSALIDTTGGRLAPTCWRPAVDVYETANALAVTVDLAGIDPETLDVTLFDDAVVVDGERRLPLIDDHGAYHAAEIRQGPFRLEVALPTAIDAERVEGRYERGLLQLTVPKVNAR